ncbi:DUF2066 domain-containing protein [Thalassotalea mangrovi]|uniref:DUF2066 domain-containing protein n=1 Tax=Thalassotalea mangrovi TaxID=2572245 RepID=A0A4U1B3N5_9GAMM|nr:DUF2066 domain-containing protein [Thalassotalea mangrovi]TKB44370.1 DUF2066 domain-containing protein [Thalassotalea mangrovi]
MKMIKILCKRVAMGLVAVGLNITAANAVQVDNLYQGQVSVPSQSAQSRQQAVGSAFRQVLVKIAGSESVASNSTLATALRRPDNYLSQYSYTQQDRQIYLLADFDQDKVNLLLQKAEVGIWGKHRPLITVWLVEEQGNQRNIIADSSAETLLEDLKKQAAIYGLPINFPLMDLTDAMEVSSADVWGRFQQPLEKASQRYGSEAIAVVRLSDSSLLDNAEKGGNTQLKAIDWTLFVNGNRTAMRYKGSDNEDLIASAVGGIAQSLYQQNSYSVTAQANHSTQIEIVNVDSMAAFKQVKEFLDSLTQVASVQVVSVKGETILFNLSLLSSEAAVRQALKLEGKLIESNDPLAPESEVQVSQFIWKG